MKRLFGSKEFSSYTARPTKTLILAALAVLLVGCGGGGGGGDDFAVTCGGHSCINNDSNDEPGNSPAEQAVLNLICFFVTLGQVSCLENDGTSAPDISTTTGLGSDEPVCHGPERCIEGSATAYAEAFDVEPNDSLSTASAASFPIPHELGLHVGFFANGTINNLTDGVDTYAFTATRSETFVLHLCGGTFRDLCADRGLDVATAYFSVHDQFGRVLLSSQANSASGNYQQMRIDAGVLYYVLVVAEDTFGQNQNYALRVSEAISQPEPKAPPVLEPAPPVLATPAAPPVGLLVTLDWMPPTTTVDGTPLLGLAGYNVYFGSLSGIYTDFRALDNPGLVTYMLDLPSSGAWFIVITALDSAGNESNFSNEGVVSVICECDLPPPGYMP